jgi:hypothetical protein
MTSTWTTDDLTTLAAADEIDVAPRRPDGTTGPATTIWIVRVGEDLYVRSYRGPDGAWYRTARRTGEGQVRATSVERAVRFEPAGDDVDRAVIDDAYRRKYGRSSYVDAMVTPQAAATTLRLVAT